MAEAAQIATAGRPRDGKPRGLQDERRREQTVSVACMSSIARRRASAIVPPSTLARPPVTARSSTQLACNPGGTATRTSSCGAGRAAHARLTPPPPHANGRASDLSVELERDAASSPHRNLLLSYMGLPVLRGTFAVLTVACRSVAPTQRRSSTPIGEKPSGFAPQTERTDKTRAGRPAPSPCPLLTSRTESPGTAPDRCRLHGALPAATTQETPSNHVVAVSPACGHPRVAPRPPHERDQA